jgi:hypothetical protein
MYSTILLAAFVATQTFAAGGGASRISDGREFGTSSGFNFEIVSDSQLRQLVEGTVAQIDRIARAPWKPEQKLTAIQQQYEKVQAYRKTAWSRSPATEHKLDLLIKPYESFPEAGYFRKQNCKSYYSTLKIDWEPTAPSEPTLKGVKRAWDNLKAICEG